MKMASAPAAIRQKRVGGMLLAYTPDGVAFFVREDPRHLGDYPRVCSVEVSLRSWDFPPITLVAGLVRFARRDLMTFQTWIDAGHAQGVRVLKNLSTQDTIFAHLVTDDVARSFRVANTMMRNARSVLQRLERQKQAWDDAVFERSREQLDRLYPTAADMWRAP